MLKGCLSRVGESKFIWRCLLKEPSEIASLLGCKNKRFETEITPADIQKKKKFWLLNRSSYPGNSAARLFFLFDIYAARHSQDDRKHKNASSFISFGMKYVLWDPKPHHDALSRSSTRTLKYIARPWDVICKSNYYWLGGRPFFL